MKSVVVCVKAVPDPDEVRNIRIDPITRNLIRHDVPLVLNPIDMHAVEAALKLKDQFGTYVTVLSMGPDDAEGVIRECLALGVDQGILLSDQAFSGADVFATAYSLAKGIRRIGTQEVVLCGYASSDSSTEWVGPELATFLDIPVVTRVQEIVEMSEDRWMVKAAFDGGYRMVQVKLPALFTVTKELNSPRALSFSGIIKARELEVIKWGVEDLGVQESEVGLRGSPTVVSRLTNLDRKRHALIIEGTIEEKAEKLIQRLADAGVL